MIPVVADIHRFKFHPKQVQIVTGDREADK